MTFSGIGNNNWRRIVYRYPPPFFVIYRYVSFFQKRLKVHFQNIIAQFVDATAAVQILCALGIFSGHAK